MTYVSRLAATAAAIALLAGPLPADTPAEGARMAHHTYLAAINSNDLNRFLRVVTDDVVFIPPEGPVMEGKQQVAPWVAGYFDTVRTTWRKRPVEFVVAGNWAFERYVYTAVDTPRDGGATRQADGQGINIYRLEPDGVWRVARDIWSGAGHVPDNEVPMTCADKAGPC